MLNPTDRFWALNTQTRRLWMSSTIILKARYSFSTGVDGTLRGREKRKVTAGLETSKIPPRGARGARGARAGLRAPAGRALRGAGRAARRRGSAGRGRSWGEGRRVASGPAPPEPTHPLPPAPPGFGRFLRRRRPDSGAPSTPAPAPDK